MNYSYKQYQLISFFVLKFSYKIMQVNNQRIDEVFLVGSKDRNYPLIRITTSSIEKVTFEKERLDHVISTIFKALKINNGRFLDVHIGKEEILDVEVYDSISIDVDYYSGPDLNDYYPGIHSVIHEVANPKSEINNIVFELKENALGQKTQRRAIKRSGVTKPIGTYIIIGICMLFFAIYSYLQSTYSQTEVLIVFGANYKTFTVGLLEVWRLITAGFLHSSILHLLFNMVSLYSLGRIVEISLGTRKYLIVLFGSLIVASLTTLAFNDNTVTVGLSGGLYGLFAFYMITAYYNNSLNNQVAMQIITLNLIMNFLSGVDVWGHVGGFIAGTAFYYAMNAKRRYIIYLLLVFALIWRVYLNDTSYTMYGGTDLNTIEVYEDLGLTEYASSLRDRIVEVWRNKS